MPHLLVTGGCGFIGSHLVDALLAEGHRVSVLDDLSTGRTDHLQASARLIVGCVTDAATVAQASEQVEGVFHLAAIASVARSNNEWLWTHRVNQTGTVTVLDVARGRRLPVVYASSAAVYGAQAAAPLSETLPPAPLTAYGADKLGSELHGRLASSIHGFSTVGLRFFNVYGPRQPPGSPYSGVISIFADRLRRGMPLTLHGDGRQTRDFIYVGDVVRGLVLAMEQCRAAPVAEAAVVNICTGHGTAIVALADRLMALAGRSVPIERAAARVGDISVSVGDPTLAAAMFGFRATTGLDDGLATLLAAPEHVPVEHAPTVHG